MHGIGCFWAKPPKGGGGGMILTSKGESLHCAHTARYF